MRLVILVGLLVVLALTSGCASEAEQRWRQNSGVPSCGFKERMADSLAALGASQGHRNVQAEVEASRSRHPWCS